MAKNKKIALKKIALIDSNALIHRAFHALPELSKKDGTLTNAVYGYLLTLLSVIEKLKPDYIVATFDLKAPTFRHKKYKEYKAKRVKAPDELYMQIPLVKELLKAFNIPIYEMKGYEADDVIGTLVKDKKLDDGLKKYIVTGDLDALQLVDADTFVYTLRRGITDTVIYDEKTVEGRYGLKANQMIDYKALRGDPSDNIPGVKGVGEKTAVDLLKKYKTLEGVYENLEKIESKSVAEKLKNGKQDAFMSYDLARIRTDVSIDFNLEACATKDYDKNQVASFLREMEFYSLLKRIGVEEDDGASDGKEKKLEKIKIKLIKGKKTADNLLKKIEEKKEAVLIFDSQNSFSLTLDSSEGFYFEKEFKNKAINILENKKIKKISFGLKEEIREIYKNKIERVEKVENFQDVKLQAYLLKSGSKIEFEKLIFEEFGAEFENKITKSGQANLLSDSQENEKKYLAEKAVWTFRLYEKYKKELEEISKKQGEKNNLKKVLEELENLLIKILAKMEILGVKVDEKIMDSISKEAQKKIDVLQKEIYDLAGEKFNINSPLQLAPILYEKLELPIEQIKRGKTGFSTDSDQLRKIRDFHPIVEKIEKYRELNKLKNTYTDVLPKLIEEDGHIHTTFNQTVTATGRLSSSEPNLQNIPKKGKFAKKIRSAFVADENKILVSADYSQIDLRVAAHVSEDKLMMKGFQEGKDIHRITAAWVNDIAEDKITDQQRREAKSLNFGVLYGMGIYGFMRDSGVDRMRAENFIDQYMQKFSGLKKFLDKTKKFAHDNGYVETEIGRRRYIKNINSSNFQVRSMAERMAINLPIQGLASDIMKMAMIDVEEKILKDYNLDEVKMILQIHDELIFEVDSKVVDKFMKEVKKVMEEVYKLRVPLVVDVNKGENWGEV